MESPGFMNSLTQDILVTCILMGLIAVVGLIGNALMMRALVRYRVLRSDFYIVFGALSIADSLFLVISVPALIIDMVEAKDVTTTGWCKTSHYLMNAFGFVAAFLIVVLAMLRGILLTNRNTISRPQPMHLLIVCVAVFVLAILSSIPITNIYSANEGYCMVVDLENIVQETWLINSFASFIPLFLVFVIYLMTYLLGKRYFSDSYSPREKERSRLVNSIIVAFIICQLPYRIVSIYEMYITHDDLEEMERMYTIKNYLMCLVMADKAVRPVLYSKLASDLSEVFDEVINCTYCHKHYSMAPSFDNAYSIAGSTCGGAGCAGSFNGAWGDRASLWSGTGGASGLVSTVSVPESEAAISHSAATSHSAAAAELGDSPSRQFDRAVSTSSSSSATSQTPLVKVTRADSIEMS
ncbi:atypical chemokine receptor 3 [Aplysia californica]|uniref:Atypical chemokine receptor 3 n=1 Tax=Aplysia californica TaxID=6500 RepID=A0ABM0JK64_APLCA|nr:atypical chemokine receptor 3 [Aplysia californica]